MILKKIIPEGRGWILIIGVFSFFLYANTLVNSYVLDDYGVLKDNKVVRRGIKGIPAIVATPYRYGVNRFSDNLYRPVSLAMFAIEWQIAPNKPALNHFVNVLFYAFSCMLLFILLRKLLAGRNPFLPLLTCLLFAAHPIHTEVVANIKSRDEIMAVFFLLLALNWLIKSLQEGKMRFFLLSLTAFLFAVFSKEGAIVFSLIFPIASWYFANTSLKKSLSLSLFYLLPVFLFIIVRQAVLSKFDDGLEITLADNLLVAIPGLSNRLATEIMLLGKYLFLLLFPYRLVSDYSYNQIPAVGWNNISVWCSLLAYATVVVYSIFKFRKKKVVVFGILFFVVTISIYSNLFFLIGSSFAERFLFLPSVGFCIVIASILMGIFRVATIQSSNPVFQNPGSQTRYLLIMVSVILSLYSWKTIERNAEWKSEETLFSADILRSPNSCHMRFYWGNTLQRRASNQPDFTYNRQLMLEAIRQYDTALVIYPDYIECYNMRGLAFYKMGEFDKAISDLRTIVTLNPSDEVAFFNLGKAYFDKGDFPNSVDIYRKALELDSADVDGHFNLGSALAMQKRYNEAIESFKKCFQLDPHNAKACFYISTIYTKLSNFTEAGIWYKRASSLEPATNWME